MDAFARTDILQVLFFSVLFGVALSALGDKGRPVAEGIDRLAQVLFRIVGLIMHVAPLGAFGAMAFTDRLVRRADAGAARARSSPASG